MSSSFWCQKSKHLSTGFLVLRSPVETSHWLQHGYKWWECAWEQVTTSWNKKPQSYNGPGQGCFILILLYNNLLLGDLIAEDEHSLPKAAPPMTQHRLSRFHLLMVQLNPHHHTKTQASKHGNLGYLQTTVIREQAWKDFTDCNRICFNKGSVVELNSTDIDKIPSI